MNIREFVAESITAAGLLCLSSASVMAVKTMNVQVIIAVVGGNLLAWGILILNASFGEEKDEE